ncbi:hypothetical protein FJZ18_00595 [Candidatus Pacearchaeota archaeon]|nr:hypothetical protein [Candidatus Pacearchaeota archaeon]
MNILQWRCLQLSILFLLSILISLSVVSFTSAAVSCDVAVSRTTVLPTDFTEQQKTARTLVFGEALGQFSETSVPSVMVDCNAKNIEPKPLEKNVKARVTYSATSLSYRADCYYPRPKIDTTYTVGATLLPDSVPCVLSVESGTITTPGSGQEDQKTTPIECGIAGAKVCESGYKCKHPAVPDGYGKCTTCPQGTTPKDGKCVGDSKGDIKKGGEDTSGLVCLDGSKPVNGKCPERKKMEKDCGDRFVYDSFNGVCIETGKKVPPPKKDDDLPQLPEDEETLTIILKNKYTFIGIPFESAELVSSTCTESVSYAYDAQKNSFIKFDSTEPDDYVGRGLLVKIPSGESCKITFKGTFNEEQTFALKKGWNLISPQTRAFEDIKNRKSDCSFLSPFVGLDGKYFKEKTMKPGSGYLVKVKSDCTLSTKNALDLPRLPE